MADTLAIAENFNDYLLYSLGAFIAIWLVIGRFTRSRLTNFLILILYMTSWITLFAVMLLEKQFKEIQERSIDQSIAFLSGILSIFILFFIIIIRNRLSLPLKQIITQTDRMADGDLSSDILLQSKGSGETQSLLHSNRVLANRFKSIIGNIKTSAEELANAAEELAAGSEEVAATTEEVTGTIQNIAEGAAEQVRRLDEVSRVLTEMVSVTEESIRQIGVTSQITLDLAEQTNLISLNGAIEAAKAGMEGQGFQVVAEHIRQLSIESKNASNTVTSISRAISNRMRDSVFRIVDSVDKIATVAENTAASSQEAAAAAEEQAASLQEITRQAQKLAELSDNSERNISEFKV
ncbi:MAG: methyl-accepting chemotaxis protein [Candidatus Kariarchaeaceae archaeon]